MDPCNPSSLTARLWTAAQLASQPVGNRKKRPAPDHPTSTQLLPTESYLAPRSSKRSPHSLLVPSLSRLVAQTHNCLPVAAELIERDVGGRSQKFPLHHAPGTPSD